MNQNCNHEEIQSRLNLGNACYHLVQNLLPPCLSKNVKIKICRTIILPVVSFECDTWSPISREEHRLRVFTNRVLRSTSGSEREEVTAGWRNL
jgi:hypothetical protein